MTSDLFERLARTDSRFVARQTLDELQLHTGMGANAQDYYYVQRYHQCKCKLLASWLVDRIIIGDSLPFELVTANRRTDG